MSAQGVQIEEKRIDVVKNWPEPKSIYNIQVFLNFAGFYCCFIQTLSRIAASLTSMLKIGPIPTLPMPNLMDLVDEFDGGNRDENKARKTSALTKRPTGADYPSSDHVNHVISNFVRNFAKNVSNYLTSDTKRVFNQLYQAFTEAPIFKHFDLEQYIRVKIDASGYAIDGVLSQLSNDLGQWHLVAYFSHKMIFAKTQYKTHNGKFLTIVEAFKTWRHYLEGTKYEVFILTDHNNF